jgi:hypothetical protein
VKYVIKKPYNLEIIIKNIAQEFVEINISEKYILIMVCGDITKNLDVQEKQTTNIYSQIINGCDLNKKLMGFVKDVCNIKG